MSNYSAEVQRLLRKENQEWEMAGCARQDGDHKGALRHTEKAKEYRQQAKDSHSATKLHN